MSKQWGHGYHKGNAEGFQKGKKQGNVEGALIGLGIAAIATVAKKTGLTDYAKKVNKKKKILNKKP
ncbi:hypothetical protein [Lactococcus lactis]|uniref:hypothetical protein n=1 Tax=Lactococcus lactis TaxID=1358 RepID=UPI00265F7272|nr:hypothetical protein [Lactococcus lactis]WKK96145.1 hypothetical protein LLUC11_03140 [Lactococcus lactis subsp. lactis]